MRCQDRTATLFRDGEPVSGASYMYTISFVQPDDVAEFDCRSGSNVVAHNLSVQGMLTTVAAPALMSAPSLSLHLTIFTRFLYIPQLNALLV